MAIDDLGHAKSGMSILITCIVQTMAETDPGFQDRFLTRLARVYSELNEHAEGDSVRHEIEMLAWTHAFLTAGTKAS